MRAARVIPRDRAPICGAHDTPPDRTLMTDTTARPAGPTPPAGPKPLAGPNPPAGPANAERPGLIATYRRLWPHLWPYGRPDLQRRVFLAFGLLLAAKLVTMVTPFTFKWITDALVAAVGGQEGGSTPVPTGLLAAPMLLIALYGVSRIAMSALTQVRDGLFAKVAMHAVRRLALQTFEHMHRLSLRFHLERKTGGLTRVLERGRAGIEELSRLMVLTLVPTIVEFVLVLGVLAYEFELDLRGDRLPDGRGLPGLHLQGDRVADRDPPPDERLRHRRQHQGGRFAAELRDGEVFRRRAPGSGPLRRVDGEVREGLDADLRVAGGAQRRAGGDLHAGHDRGDVARRPGHPGGAHHDRRLRAGQHHAGAALDAAQLHGHDLPRDQTGADRHRRHVPHPRAEPRDRRPAGRGAARRGGRHGAVRGRALRLQSRAADPAGRLLRDPGGPDGGGGRALRGPASRRSRACCSGSTSRRPAGSASTVRTSPR